MRERRIPSRQRTGNEGMQMVDTWCHAASGVLRYELGEYRRSSMRYYGPGAPGCSPAILCTSFTYSRWTKGDAIIAAKRHARNGVASRWTPCNGTGARATACRCAPCGGRRGARGHTDRTAGYAGADGISGSAVPRGGPVGTAARRPGVGLYGDDRRPDRTRASARARRVTRRMPAPVIPGAPPRGRCRHPSGNETLRAAAPPRPDSG